MILFFLTNGSINFSIKNVFFSDYLLFHNIMLYRVKYIFRPVLKALWSLRVRIKPSVTEGMQLHCLLLAHGRIFFLSFFLPPTDS